MFKSIICEAEFYPPPQKKTPQKKTPQKSKQTNKTLQTNPNQVISPICLEIKFLPDNLMQKDNATIFVDQNVNKR